jgi:uncharacterized membrane protein YsdA (DUF1294 family)
MLSASQKEEIGMDYLLAAMLTYLITLNIFGFVLALADKRRAQQKKWRTPEKRFLLVAAAGGGPGVLLGFLAFRHKTRHYGLMAGVAALTVFFYAAVISARFLLS